MKDFVWINIIFFLNFAFGQVGGKKLRQRASTSSTIENEAGYSRVKESCTGWFY